MTWDTIAPGEGDPFYDNAPEPRPYVALYVDVADVLDNTSSRRQTAVGGRRSDGVPLLYAAAVNVLLGAPEAGKTLCAAAMAADELFAGGRVLWVDLDHNGAHAIAGRLRQLGVPRDTLTDPTLFRLSLPDEPETVTDIVADAHDWRPTLAVVDSVGELLPMFGANSNDADDYTRVNRQVLAALAAAGAGVLAIDHEAKSVESRTYGATGSAAKKRAVDGALIRVTNIRPFAPGQGGEAQLSIVKDRHGALRQLGVGSGEPRIAGFTLTAIDDDGLLARFPVPITANVFDAPVDDIDALADLTPPPASVRDVMARLRWGRPRAQQALRVYRQRADSSTDQLYPEG